MPNSLSSTGLTTATRQELLANFTANLQAIYGTDIDLDADTPDGQWINILIQSILDLQDLLVQVYNSLDPDNAIGVVLDQRVAINGIQRQGGTFTVTNVTITTSQSVNLYGLDQDAQAVYTVADNAGNQWQLQTTILGTGVGPSILAFQSATPGAVLTIPNTITIPVSIILGVTSINNPTTYTTLGINEESDADLRIRRQKSIALPSQGYFQGLLAGLLNLTGMTFAFIEENVTNATNADGVPAHSIWVIVAGTATDEDIATTIYTYRNAGCGMYGGTSFPIVQLDGSTFLVYWDTVVPVPLYTEFTVASLDGTNVPDIAAIRSGLVTSFVPEVAAQVNSNQVGTLVQAIDSNTLVSGVGFSIGTVQTVALSGIAASGTFKFSYGAASTAAINWNDNAATIQSAIRAISGLGSITVSGSIASQSLVITMTGVTDPLLLGENSNSLLTGGSVAITFNFFSTFTATLTPALKKNQFVVEEDNIIILPMIISCPACSFVISSGTVTGTTISVASGGSTLQFTGLGGYGDYTFSKTGAGTVDSLGLYTSAGAGTDTVTVTDVQGHSATATITVV